MFDVRCSMFGVQFPLRSSILDPPSSTGCWMFDVRCWMFDVRCLTFSPLLHPRSSILSAIQPRRLGNLRYSRLGSLRYSPPPIPPLGAVSFPPAGIELHREQRAQDPPGDVHCPDRPRLGRPKRPGTEHHHRVDQVAGKLITKPVAQDVAGRQPVTRRAPCRRSFGRRHGKSKKQKAKNSNPKAEN